MLLERLSDRSRNVRESAVRALGRIGDMRALPALGELFHAPGPVGAGVVYDALIGVGPEAGPVFVRGLRSQVESVRIASCFGVAALAEPRAARPLLRPLLQMRQIPTRILSRQKSRRAIASTFAVAAEFAALVFLPAPDSRPLHARKKPHKGGRFP